MKYLIPCHNCGKIIKLEDPELSGLSEELTLQEHIVDGELHKIPYRKMTFCSDRCGFEEYIKTQNEILIHKELDEWEKWFYKRYHERLLENTSSNNISE